MVISGVIILLVGMATEVSLLYEDPSNVLAAIGLAWNVFWYVWLIVNLMVPTSTSD